MSIPISRTTVIFERPFSLPGLAEVLPAGEYDLETTISAPPDHRDPDRWKASTLVLLRLHARKSQPGLARSLTVPLSAIAEALDRDKLSGGCLVDFFVEEMLADPMVQLVMRVDRVSEDEIRTLYSRHRSGPSDTGADRNTGNGGPTRTVQDRGAIHAAGSEGMPPRHR
jgi:hypothetical protein